MDASPQSLPNSSDTPDPTDKHELRREIIDFLKLVAWFLIIFLTLRAYVIEGYEVQGESMEPTLSNNERILVLKLPHELSKFPFLSGIEAITPGDIVVFDSPDSSGKRYVKRVIAKGATPARKQTVNAGSSAEFSERPVKVIFDHGDVYVNNRKLEEEYIPPDARLSHEEQELVLGPGEYYVLGDNRTVSKDSRSFQAVHDNAIIGKAVFRFWPPSRISLIQ